MTVPAGVFPTGTPNYSATGTLSVVNNAIAIVTDTLGSVDFALDGSPVGASVIFESTSDGGSTWIPSKAYPKGGTGAAGSTTAATAGVYNVTAAGAQQIRVRLTAITSGSFTATANGTLGAAHIGVKNSNPDDHRILSVTDWGGSIAPPGPSFWESMSRIGTPVFGFLQEQPFGQSGINSQLIIDPASTRRLYVRKIVMSTDALASCLLTLLPDSNNVRPSSIEFGNQFWRRSIPLAPIGSDSPYMPTTVFMPFYLNAGVLAEFDFEGELFLDPGTALAFSCHGVAPNPNGAVSFVSVTAGGTSYATAPTVAFSGGSGTGAAGTAIISGGAVTGVTMTSIGTGYTSTPTIAFSGGGGSGAAATAAVTAFSPAPNPHAGVFVYGYEVDFDAY